jgi:hypothetical protein
MTPPTIPPWLRYGALGLLVVLALAFGGPALLGVVCTSVPDAPGCPTIAPEAAVP